jgi:hypothetical protein
MNSDLGSPSYRVIPSDKFARAAKVMKKSYKSSRESQAFLNLTIETELKEIFTKIDQWLDRIAQR